MCVFVTGYLKGLVLRILDFKQIGENKSIIKNYINLMFLMNGLLTQIIYFYFLFGKLPSVTVAPSSYGVR